MACVDLPEFPLQLVLRRHPTWKSRPAAVVDRDKPQGRLLWVNEEARRARILPGMRYAAALSLSGELRASEVAAYDIDDAVESILTLLWKFTPEVEPSSEEPGVFWLGATGLAAAAVSSPLSPPEGTVSPLSPERTASPVKPLYDSLTQWARCIRSSLASEERFESTVAVGFRRFATWALARAMASSGTDASRGIAVFMKPADETNALRRVPLDRLAIDPEVRDTLRLLGVRLVGEFTDLPREGIEKRFGDDAWRLYRQASGEIQEPLTPRPQETPIQKRIHLDDAEIDQDRLMAIIERALEPLFGILTDRQQATAEIELHLQLDRAPPRTEHLRPATPTTDRAELCKLIRLRLEKCLSVEPAHGGTSGECGLGGGVTDLTLVVEGAHLRSTQLELFQARPARDLGAANRALAFLRAKFGDEAIVRARLREAHLPEALFVWETFSELSRAAPLIVDSGMLVRRVYASPIELPARPRHEPDGWMLRNLEEGPVVRVLGPYIVSGGWWRRAAHREYHFAETQKGEILWVYYDRFRRRWFLQGRVE